jgi:hypothetical protein
MPAAGKLGRARLSKAFGKPEVSGVASALGGKSAEDAASGGNVAPAACGPFVLGRAVAAEGASRADDLVQLGIVRPSIPDGDTGASQTGARRARRE